MLAPASCTNETYAIKREINVMPTINSDEMNLSMDLWLDMHNIAPELSSSSNLKYAITTDPNSCTNGLVKMGNLKGKNTTTDNKVELFNYMGYNQSTTDTFYLYIACFLLHCLHSLMMSELRRLRLRQWRWATNSK